MIQASNLFALIDHLRYVETHLSQDTADQFQLKPADRLTSMSRVWNVIRPFVNNVGEAIDIGSGFGYGIALLCSEGIRAIGVENVKTKIDQGRQLFDQAGLPIKLIAKLDFDNAPAVIHGDFLQLENEQKQVGLITVFYLSGQLIKQPGFFSVCRQLLLPNGKIVLSTEYELGKIQAHLDQLIPNGFKICVTSLTNNFEQTVILLEKT